MDAITGIKRWGIFSWKKYDTKLNNFSSVVCFLGHILPDNVEAQNFPFQLKLGLNECHFGLPQLWIVIQLTLSMCILCTRNQLVTMRNDKVKWISPHICGKPKWHSFTPSLSWKGRILGHQHCVTKRAIENKILNQNLILGHELLFSREDTSPTDTSYCIHILWEVCCSVFIEAPCISRCAAVSVQSCSHLF